MHLALSYTNFVVCNAHLRTPIWQAVLLLKNKLNIPVSVYALIELDFEQY